MKIDKLFKDYDRVLAEKSSVEETCAGLEEEVRRLEGEAEAAASKGDFTLYKDKKEAASQAKEALYVSNKHLEALNLLLPKEDAISAWQEYAEGYNRSFEKNWKAYEKARGELFAAFAKLVDQQNEAFKIREKCGACCGERPEESSYGFYKSFDRSFPMKLLPDSFNYANRPHDSVGLPDTQFFRDYELASEKDDEIFRDVIRLHHSI